MSDQILTLSPEVPDNNNSKRKAIIIIVVLVVISVFLGVMLYTSRGSGIISPLTNKQTSLRNDAFSSNVKNVQAPLTGIMYSSAEATLWENIRPLGVMLNNHVDARPQAGLVHSDVVYEIVAEGGITRYLAFFLTNTPENIGPVRSTREYYLVLVKEMGDAMIMHEGYSPQALEAIETWPVRSLQRGGASAVANRRDTSRDVAWEHTLFTNGRILREQGNLLGWEGTRDIRTWQFKDEQLPPMLPSAGCYVGACTDIEIHFWFEGDYSAIWKYDVTTNRYIRHTGYDSNGLPIPLLDRDTNEPVTFKNLVVQFVSETGIAGDDKNRLEYELVGSGEGLVFIDGNVLKTTWSKASRDERTVFYDENGNEMVFNRGNFWISIVPDRNKNQVIY